MSKRSKTPRPKIRNFEIKNIPIFLFRDNIEAIFGLYVKNPKYYKILDYQVAYSCLHIDVKIKVEKLQNMKSYYRS